MGAAVGFLLLPGLDLAMFAVKVCAVSFCWDVEMKELLEKSHAGGADMGRTPRQSSDFNVVVFVAIEWWRNVWE